MCHVFSCHGGSCCSCVLVFVNALVVDAVHVLECFSCHGGSRCFYFVMAVHVSKACHGGSCWHAINGSFFHVMLATALKCSCLFALFCVYPMVVSLLRTFHVFAFMP